MVEDAKDCQTLTNIGLIDNKKGDFPDDAITDNIYAIDDTGEFRRDRHAGRNTRHAGEKLAPIR